MQKLLHQSRLSAVLLGLGLAALSSHSVAATDSRVYSPDSEPFDRSYANWSAQWVLPTHIACG
jgi:hypothetical protein